MLLVMANFTFHSETVAKDCHNYYFPLACLSTLLETMILTDMAKQRNQLLRQNMELMDNGAVDERIQQTLCASW